jgi:hypothetical protein
MTNYDVCRGSPEANPYGPLVVIGSRKVNGVAEVSGSSDPLCFSAYQQAPYLVPNPKVCNNTFEKWCWSLMLLQKDSKLWAKEWLPDTGMCLYAK